MTSNNVQQKNFVITSVSVEGASSLGLRDLKASHILVEWCFVPIGEHREMDAYKGSVSVSGVGIHHLLRVRDLGKVKRARLVIVDMGREAVLDEGAIRRTGVLNGSLETNSVAFLMQGQHTRRWLFECKEVQVPPYTDQSKLRLEFIE